MSETWEAAILRIVRAKNGVIELQEIYEKMEGHPLVTPHHLELWTNGQPIYQCQTRAHLSNIEKRGAVRRVSRGLYIAN